MKPRIERLTLVLALLVILATLCQSGMAQNIKIAVVDLDLIVAQSAAGKKLQSELEQFEKTAQSEVEAKRQHLVNIQRRGAEGAGVLSQPELAQLGQEFEQTQKELADLQAQKQQEGQQMRQKGLEAIQKLLEPVFAQVTSEGGYDIILNRTPGIVLYSSEKVEITERVRQLLAAQNPGG